MVELSEWQWGIGAGVLIALLIIGSFINRQQSEPEAIKQTDGPSLLNAGSNELDGRAEQAELSELRKQLQARDSELKDAQEEAELTLLQLHQVQEELEKLFLHNQTQAQARDSESNELNDLRKQLQARDSELKDAQEEAELTLLQLHQVQEELEKLFLHNQTQAQARDSESNELNDLRKQLQARDSESNELNDLRKQLQARDSESNELNDLRKQLQARDSELKDAQEEAELTLLQLHQVQEELEHYFLESRKQVSSQALTSAQLDQFQRIKQRLIHQLKASPAQDNSAFKHIVRRQQNALRRFQRLHQKH